jgi:ATP-dependent Clp protease ATP-binding subunit ClpB
MGFQDGGEGASRSRVLASDLMREVKRHFAPEFLNRIDEIVRFRSLTRDDIGQIVEIQLRGLSERMAVRRLELEVTDDAKAWLAERGYDEAYGARPLKRLIQREISDPLPLALLEGRYSEGARVVVDVAGDDLVLK